MTIVPVSTQRIRFALTPAMAAEWFGVSDSTVRHWACDGSIVCLLCEEGPHKGSHWYAYADLAREDLDRRKSGKSHRHPVAARSI